MDWLFGWFFDLMYILQKSICSVIDFIVNIFFKLSGLEIRRSRQGAKFNTLYGGDTSGYPSHSNADSALVFTLAWWTQDPAQIDRIFRSSGLYRDKWDSLRGGTTYGGLLIDDALSRVTPRTPPTRNRTHAYSGGAEM